MERLVIKMKTHISLIALVHVSHGNGCAVKAMYVYRKTWSVMDTMIAKKVKTKLMAVPSITIAQKTSFDVKIPGDVWICATDVTVKLTVEMNPMKQIARKEISKSVTLILAYANGNQKGTSNGKYRILEHRQSTPDRS